MMNTKKAPTDDINFRAAVTYAFDYQTVTKNIFPGYHQAAGPVPSALPGHDPNAVAYQRDVAKAMDYLKKSKYYGQLDKYPIVYHWIAEVPDEEKVALLFADNMKDIGVSVQVVKVPWLSVVDEMGKLETSPNIVTIFVEASYAEAGSIMIQRYHSSSTGTWEQNEWLQNSTVDNMLDDAVATVDTTQRLDKYIKAQQVLMSMYLSIYVVDQSEIRGYYAGYVDWYATKGQNNPIMGYNWDVRLIGFDAAKKHELFPG
jgi:peptide/nickel transport system substrate-binding protein